MIQDADTTLPSNHDRLDLSTRSAIPHSAGRGQVPFPLYQQPCMPNDSPESIAMIFDRRICEVLSIKDGPSGNPWRVIVWPLAKRHATIYHAVAAMTYFQRANALPQHRVRGIRHLQASIQRLGVEDGDVLPVRVALMATLALAFAQTWYYPRSTCGIHHVRSAKRLLQAALLTGPCPYPSALHRDTSQAIPLSFLAKTWIYMDVLTRITCDNIEAIDTGFISQCADSADTESAAAGYKPDVDPLMGCAGPLFPLLGRVADLVRCVRRRGVKTNSAAIVSQAVELKGSIEQWSPWAGEEADSLINEGDVLTPAASDLVQTAHAYKWAALLLLCQAVPELPSRFSFECIAQKILLLIATVPVESKASIFHVFPLMIAGCDTTDVEDRDWVRDRWRKLSSGNSSGISERCLELTSEVWARRDRYDSQQQGESKKPKAIGSAYTCVQRALVKNRDEIHRNMLVEVIPSGASCIGSAS